MQVLIVEDDIKLAYLLQKLFNNNGFNSFYALGATEAKEAMYYLKFEALVVDYMMPQTNGIEFLQELRSKNVTIPVLMLTAVDEVDNKLVALNNLAEDYVTKPFNSQELIFRVKNLIRRNNITMSNSTVIQVGNMTFNLNTYNLKIEDQEIKLSSSDIGLFKIFINNLNTALAKEEILQHLGKTVNESNLNSLNVNIMRLRKKIEKDSNNPKYLKTVRSKGFILVAD